MTTALGAALREKFATPEDVLKALGLDEQVIVGDAKPKEKPAMAKMSRKAAVATATVGFLLGPMLAKDAKLAPADVGKVFEGVTSKNWAERKKDLVSGVSKLIAGKLAQPVLAGDQSVGATPDDVALALIEMLDDAHGGGGEMPMPGGKPPMEEDESVSEAQHNAMEAAAHGSSTLGIPEKVGKEFVDKDKAKDNEPAPRQPTVDNEPAPTQPTVDDDPHAKLKEFLAGKLSPEDMVLFEQLMGQHLAGGADQDPKLKELGAADQPPDFPGMPKPGGTMVGGDKGKAKDEKMENVVTKPAMDAAIKTAVEDAEKKATEKARAIREAEKAVRPYVGDIAIACDSAPDVYRTAFKMLGVKVDGVDPSAYPTILSLVPKPGEKKREATRVAMDSAKIKSFAERFPNASRVEVL